jgi:hypothetical protein
MSVKLTFTNTEYIFDDRIKILSKFLSDFRNFEGVEIEAKLGSFKFM